MIREIEIKHYRLFHEFEISALAKVNLIVGDNNSGKTSLLEAIHLSFERDGDGRDYSSGGLHVKEKGFLLDNRVNPKSIMHPNGKSIFLTTNYIGYDELAVLWDKITSTPKEDRVVEALQILEPLVDRISFTTSQTSQSSILLCLKGEKEPIPFSSMGDGMRRIMAITAALVSVENGTLLVDEIDTGLYHGTLTNMWRLVLETSAKQNTQVFATTHSWDCVKAFQQALEKFNAPDIGKLIRLEKTGSKVQAVLYSADELDIAVEQGIEVR
jgi:AAA15 family ATPase/GTPase